MEKGGNVLSQSTRHWAGTPAGLPVEIGAAETIVQPHEGRKEINWISQRPRPNVAQTAAQRIVEQLQAEHMQAKLDNPTQQKGPVSSKSCLEFILTYESS